jgi:acrylyl-CoA reductase (NADPH)
MFRALRANQAQDVPHSPVDVALVELSDAELPEGDVTIDVEYSSLNYKDALALQGKPGVIRQYPLVAGIDLVGTVSASDCADWAPGDRVVLNGWGIGESHDGGLAERTRVKGEWLVPLPEGLTPKRAAAIGTAGFTAMLAMLALERAGTEPDAGPVLVTGAAGGVGSIAIALLAGLGYTVAASTGRPEETDYLRSLGATDIVDRAALSEPGKPLQSQRWAAAIDSVGGSTLANVLAQVDYGGTVASCGLAQSSELPTTVMPFILRSVTLTGINSVFAPVELRREAWRRLATDLDPGLLDGLTSTIALGDAIEHSAELLAGRVRGRTVVDVRA